MTLSEAIQEAGLLAPKEVIADGRIHRFKSEPKSNNKNGWYILFNNGDFEAGNFGCWKLGINEKYLSIDKNHFTDKQKQQHQQQLADAQRQIGTETDQRQAQAKQEAQKRFNQASTTINSHPYLDNKQLRVGSFKENAFNLRRDKNWHLLVPIYFNDEMVNTQFINAQSKKWFLTGGQVKACYHIIGDINHRLYICEGWATGASIHLAISEAVVVAFSASNLLAVAKYFKHKYPSLKIIIAADNDQHSKTNTGKENAINVAQTLNCDYVLPEFKDTDLKDKACSDFNDIHCLYGLDEVKHQLTQPPPISEPLNQFDSQGKKKAQATLLIDIAQNCQLFHNSEGKAFAQLNINNHQEVWAVDSVGFKDYLNQQYYQITNRGANSNALRDALDTIRAKAKYDDKEQAVYLRIAQINDKIYIDLCNRQWQVIEVSTSGYKILNKSPVMFWRSQGMQPLPKPKPNDNVELMKKYLNIKDTDFYLIVAWVLAALQAGAGAYPILILHGEQGTAKTTTARMLRELTDPHSYPISTRPRNEDDLTIMASNNRVIALDNLSGITRNMSDTLCGFATGTNQLTRKLYTNTDLVQLKLKCPVILNGIDDIATRGDLTSRSLIINLPSINQYKNQTKLWQDFKDDLPNIFGTLLNGLVSGLKNIACTPIDNAPRMADFAKWVSACTKAYNWNDEFIKAYRDNIGSNNQNLVDGSLFATTIIDLAHHQNHWKGTASDLLKELPDKLKISTPRGIKNQIKRYKPALTTAGVDINYHRSHGKNLISISKQISQSDITLSD